MQLCLCVLEEETNCLSSEKHLTLWLIKTYSILEGSKEFLKKSSDEKIQSCK